jgi:K+-sensing histidine kinase KdpD
MGSVSLSSLPVRYGVAPVGVALAVAARLLLDPLIALDAPFLLFFGTILVSAWYGGLGPGLLATALATLASHYLFLHPTASQGEAVALVTFVAEGLLISSLVAALRSAKREAQASTLRGSKPRRALSAPG